MIDNDTLEQSLKVCDEISYVKVEGDGYHYQLTIVSDTFTEKSLVARQQWVYKKLKDYIVSGSLHAITMKTYTTEEWEKSHG